MINRPGCVSGPVFCWVKMNVYTDESGDLGWSFDRPYQAGGSSRYFTISHLIIPKTAKHLSKRIVKDLYGFMPWPTNQELKASNLKKKHRVYFAQKVAALLEKNKKIKISSITVYKQNVQEKFKGDSNKLYNYMIRLSLLEYIRAFPRVTLMTDRRSTKVISGNAMHDYLQTTLWGDLESETILEDRPRDSQSSLNIQFVDFITNFVWRSHELQDMAALNIVSKHLMCKRLFFPKFLDPY